MGKLSTSHSFSSDLVFDLGFHEFQPFSGGRIDVKLPPPNADVRLFVFKPSDYPYLWIKYLEGVQIEYSRMGVSHILDMDKLNDPSSASLGMLAIQNGDIVAGIRFHGPLVNAEMASVLHEMEGGDTELLKQYIGDWIPYRVLEPKGLWINTKNNGRKRLLCLMARCGIYGALLLNCRYTISTNPQGVNRIYDDVGLKVVDSIGSVPYPHEGFKTRFGYVDVNNAIERSSVENKSLLQREWHQINYTRVNTDKESLGQHWKPVILDQGNPFHSPIIEAILLNPGFNKSNQYKCMKKEIDVLLPKVSESIKNENKYWIVFPWKSTVAEMLGPKGFRRLRYDRNRNKITSDEQDQLSKLKIGIVGLSTGHVIAHTLVMEGICGFVRLADFDVLELSNLNRIPSSVLDIGTNKAVVAARRLAEADPYLQVEVIEDGITSANVDRFMSGLDIVIDECDSMDIKLLLRKAAIKHKIPVLMATSDMGMLDVERFDLDDDLEPFHGLMDVSLDELHDLSRSDSAAYALKIVEGEKITARLGASLFEIGRSITTWPQLASDVFQGAAMVAPAVRRIGTGKSLASGRVRINMEESLEENKAPQSDYNLSSIEHSDSTSVQFCGQANKDMLLAATLAPSPGNIQPWKIYWKDNCLLFYIERELTTSMDVKNRGALIALGAACLNAEVVANHYGVQGGMELFPSKDKNLVARFVLSESKSDKPNSSDPGLFPYILKRSTNRNIGSQQEISQEALLSLKSIEDIYDVSTYFISEKDSLKNYSKIASESDRIRYLCSHLHKEMMQELILPGKNSLREGIDVRTLGLSKKDLSILPILQRQDIMAELAQWGAGDVLGDYNSRRIESSSAMVLLTASGDSELDYMLGGKALQHFWLLAEQHGLAVHPISPIFLYANCQNDVVDLMNGEYLQEVNRLQSEFGEIFGLRDVDRPILLLRLSYAKYPAYRSLRREA